MISLLLPASLARDRLAKPKLGPLLRGQTAGSARDADVHGLRLLRHEDRMALGRDRQASSPRPVHFLRHVLAAGERREPAETHTHRLGKFVTPDAVDIINLKSGFMIRLHSAPLFDDEPVVTFEIAGRHGAALAVDAIEVTEEVGLHVRRIGEAIERPAEVLARRGRTR